MIFWKDFLLDDQVGPSLVIGEIEDLKCRRTRLGSPSIMDDAIGKHSGGTECALQIQETGQEQRPARMAGFSSLDSAQSDTEVSRGNRATSRRRREG